MAETAIETALAEIKGLAANSLDVENLRVIRTALSNVTFKAKLADAATKLHNRPDVLLNISETLKDIKFVFRDRLAERVDQHSATNSVAINGGVALSAGSILALATQLLTYPPLALVPLAVGTYYGWQGLLTSKRLALEISVINDNIGLLDDLIASATIDE